MHLKQWVKSALSALLGITLWMAGPSPVKAAGTTPLALAIQLDSQGNAVPGCLLYFYVAGTVASPQVNYSDFALTLGQSQPLACDQSGRVPMHWLADGLIHIRLTTAAGTPIIDTTMQVLGPSSGGGGGGSTVDPTTIASTGDEKTRYGTGVISGWVRENGLTIGNATSGATERANSDTQVLWIYLYTTDANLAVSGGRTGNALNDYNSSKQLTLPDMRGRVNGFLADMGNSASTVLTAASCASPTVLGFACGNQTFTILTTNLPAYTPSFVSTPTWAGVFRNYAVPAVGGEHFFVSQVSGDGAAGSGTFISNTALSPQGGASTPFALLQPMMLKTIYVKL